jgi:hypothetical protein
MNYCPHRNAKNLKTTVTELIECIGSDIAGYSTEVMWWARNGPERRKDATIDA